jgi:hypothetical protein
MIRKSAYRFSLATNAKRLRGDHAQINDRYRSGPSDELTGRFRIKGQLRVACQVPLQRSPVMMPLQRPEPELPTSRPPPLAREAPTETLTATLPPRPTEPETLPPPADATRVPATVKGTL